MPSFERCAVTSLLMLVLATCMPSGLRAQMPRAPQPWLSDGISNSLYLDLDNTNQSAGGDVTGASFIQPVLPPETSGTTGMLADLQTSALDPQSAAVLNNNFTAPPDFSGGILIEGPDVALKVGGYVKADLIYDLDPIGSTDFFDTTTIPTSGPPHRNARFHARQSRLSFDTRWRVDGQTVRAFIESDFFGGEPRSDSLFRLRHAYGHFGRFTAGQTWTTFTDPSAVPQTLDSEGAVSSVHRRQGLIRWDQPIFGDAMTVAVAIEDPNIVLTTQTQKKGDGRTESPDFISRLRIEPDWGEFQAALLLRKLGYQPFGEPVISKTAWGCNFTGSFFVLARTKVYYQLTVGDGIGSYRGSPDVVATGPDSGEILPMSGWMFGVHHEWTDSLTSNLTFSELSLDDLPGQDLNNLRRTTYLAFNLIANPYKRVFCGVEYLYGSREDLSGAEGSAHRLQASFGFFLP